MHRVSPGCHMYLVTLKTCPQSFPTACRSNLGSGFPRAGDDSFNLCLMTLFRRHWQIKKNWRLVVPVINGVALLVELVFVQYCQVLLEVIFACWRGCHHLCTNCVDVQRIHALLLVETSPILQEGHVALRLDLGWYLVKMEFSDPDILQ